MPNGIIEIEEGTPGPPPEPLLINPLPPPPLEWITPDPPEFETLATVELGTAATPDDGFDLLMAEAIAHIEGGQSDSASLPGTVAEVEIETPGFSEDDVSPAIVELTPALEEADEIITTMGVDLGIIDPPPPPPPPPPGNGNGNGNDGACETGIVSAGGVCCNPGELIDPITGSCTPTEF